MITASIPQLYTTRLPGERRLGDSQSTVCILSARVDKGGGVTTAVSDDQFDQKDFRTTMGQFCTGVVIATGAPDGVPAGFAAQSFVSLSLDPPLVAICPGKGSTSWPKIRDSGAFCVNMLLASQVDVCNNFAQSGGDKFSDLAWSTGVTGAPILADALAYVECTLENEVDAGDHTIAIGRVKAYKRLDEASGPLLFFRGKYGQFQEL